MGVVSGSARAAGGRVVGVRPYAMAAVGGEKAHPGVKEKKAEGVEGALEQRAEDEVSVSIFQYIYREPRELIESFGDGF